MHEWVHVFFNSLIYLPYAFIIYLCVAFAPALALFPRMTEKPAYFAGIPLVSLLINAGFAAVLFKFQCYTHTVVLSISAMFIVTAVVRQYYFAFQQKWEAWGKSDKYLILINLMIMVPLLVKCGLSAFYDDDALVSWNMWAQYYYFGNVHPVVFFPASGYPPLFPLMLSYAYKFLGTTDYQGVVKTLLVIFPFTIFNCIALAGNMSKKSWLVFSVFVLITWNSVFGEMGLRFFSMGYADPLLAASLTLSVFWLVLYCDDDVIPEKKDFLLLLTVLASIAASLSKQPGFLWALFSFPLILILKMVKERRINGKEIVAIVVVCIPVLMWILGPGRHFANNTGVIQTSLGTGNIGLGAVFSTLGFSVMEYWIKSPEIFLLYVWAAFLIFRGSSIQSTRKKFALRWVFLSYILPATILWFIFGAYSVRLGIQLLAMCTVIIGFCEFYPLNRFSASTINFKKLSYICMGFSILAFVFFSINQNYVKHGFVRGHLYPLNGPKTIIYHFFDQNGYTVYTQIYLHPEKKLWIPSIFIQALFAHNNVIVSPPETGNIQSVYQNIVETQPDYILTGDYPDQFLAEDAFKKIAVACPFQFPEVKLLKLENKFNYKVFRYISSSDLQSRCEGKLAELDVRSHSWASFHSTIGNF